MSESEALRNIAKNLESLRERLKEGRNTHQWTRDDVADYCGTSRTCIQNFEENGSEPKLLALAEIKALCEVWGAKEQSWRDNPDDPDYRRAKNKGRVDFRPGRRAALAAS